MHGSTDVWQQLSATAVVRGSSEVWQHWCMTAVMYVRESSGTLHLQCEAVLVRYILSVSCIPSTFLMSQGTRLQFK